jgi:cobalamin-dependent methionine synthase I
VPREAEPVLELEDEFHPEPQESEAQEPEVREAEAQELEVQESGETSLVQQERRGVDRRVNRYALAIKALSVVVIATGVRVSARRPLPPKTAITAAIARFPPLCP